MYIVKQLAGFLKKEGINKSIPVDVIDILHHLGFNINTFAPDAETQNVSAVIYTKQKNIYLSDALVEGDRRRTLGMLIAHLALEGTNGSALVMKEDVIYEDLMALSDELRMPTVSFLKAYQKFGSDIERLAKTFNVTSSDALRRLESMKIEPTEKLTVHL